MAAGLYDLIVEAGATYTRVFTWSTGTPATPVNLTGYTAHAQLRDSHGVLLVDLTVGAGLTLGGSAGTITLTMTPAQTLLIPQLGGSWDLKLTAGDGTVTRLLQGLVQLSPEVTQ